MRSSQILKQTVYTRPVVSDIGEDSFLSLLQLAVVWPPQGYLVPADFADDLPEDLHSGISANPIYIARLCDTRTSQVKLSAAARLKLGLQHTATSLRPSSIRVSY